MSKETVACTIDLGLRQKAQKLNINISRSLNKYLKCLVSEYTNSDEDLYLISNQIEEVRQKIFELKEEENQLLAQKISIEEKNKRASQQELKDLVKQADLLKRSRS